MSTDDNLFKFPSIQCPQCKMISYHPDDIDNKYCGNCKEFHEHMNTIDQQLLITMHGLIEAINELRLTIIRGTR